MYRFKNSWALAKASWAVLKAEKELLAIPVISFVCSIVVVGIFGGAVYASIDITDTVGQASEVSPTPLTYVLGAVGYLVMTFVVVYFTAVLVSGAYQRLSGSQASLSSAFGEANRRLPQIAGWAMLTGTVGLVLSALRSRAGFIGQIVISLVGMAWEIVTWLAIPVVVVEGTGPVTSLKRAAHLFRKTWGENLIAQFGLGAVQGLATLVVVGLAALVFVGIPLAGILVGIVGLAGVAIVMGALNGIYRTALYLYAATEQAPSYFTEEQMESAFRQRAGRLG